MMKMARDVDKGEQVTLKGRSVRVVEKMTAKTGKHGHAKIHLVGVDEEGKKVEELMGAKQEVAQTNILQEGTWKIVLFHFYLI